MVTQFLHLVPDALDISIHTTTQVVTCIWSHLLSYLENFNPHHHAGGDDRERCNPDPVAISIHTTTQVVTRKLFYCKPYMKISIHTTTQVVTMVIKNKLVPYFISIHTTTQVVTIMETVSSGRYLLFQSTPPRRW